MQSNHNKIDPTVTIIYQVASVQSIPSAVLTEKELHI